VKSALLRYRVSAWVVGVMLLILVGVAMPLKYLAGQPLLVQTVGPLHGFLYMVYLATAFDLAVRCRWRLSRTVPVLLAGTIPVLSFVAERKVTGWVHARAPETAGGPGRPAPPAGAGDADRPAAPAATGGSPRPRTPDAG
jgi:integral membrane protein